MKKVAATKGHSVSLADFFGKTEVRADSAIVGSRAGALAAANFYGCLHAYKYSSPQRLVLWKLRLFRIRTSLSGVKKKPSGPIIFRETIWAQRTNAPAPIPAFTSTANAFGLRR